VYKSSSAFFIDPHCPAWLRKVSELVAINDGAFKHHLDRYKYPERFEDTQTNPRPDHRHLAMTVMLEPLEARLSSSRFLGGDEACATDIGIFPFIRQYAAIDPAWFADLPLPQVKAWMSYWLSHPVFDGCMQKLPPQEKVPFPSMRPSPQQDHEMGREILVR
jgi:glutathione S-transferase